MKKFFSGLLAAALTLTLAVPSASALELEDAKTLLSQYYYNGVPEEVLELDSLDAILEALGMEPLDLNDYQKTTVTEDFYGTLYSSSGVRWLPPDSIDTYVSGEGITNTYYDNGKLTDGPLYVDSYLSVKDKYSYFLGGVQGLRVLRTQNTDAPKILMVRDSYTDSLAPFLTERFSEIHLFDLRYNNISLKSYIEENDIDTVVVLYSFSNFVTDQNLFLLGQ